MSLHRLRRQAQHHPGAAKAGLHRDGAAGAPTCAEEVLEAHPDGIMLSNGPGDPAENVYQIAQIQKLLGKVPLFGICLGHQLTALAAGGKTYKLKYGHRGVNQPVKDLDGVRTYITSQNHGYAVDGESMPGEAASASSTPTTGPARASTIRAFRPSPSSSIPRPAPGPRTRDFCLTGLWTMMKGGTRVMPLDKSIKKVLVIGSGPIVIGQAAEFDYAGAQACRVLKDAGRGSGAVSTPTPPPS